MGISVSGFRRKAAGIAHENKGRGAFRQEPFGKAAGKSRAFGLRLFNPWNDLKNIRTRQKGTKMVD
jgi:hypothetical protein